MTRFLERKILSREIGNMRRVSFWKRLKWSTDSLVRFQGPFSTHMALDGS